MSYKVTPTLAAAMLNALKAQLDGGRIYIFAGAVPTDASEALDMVTEHTELAELTLNGGGVTGLTFDTTTSALISKAVAEVWSGLVAFDGFAGPGPGTLTPTFFRFCESGDDGRGDGAGLARLQGTVGGPASAADGRLGSDTLTDNAANTTGASIFTVSLSSFG